jgi:D-alanyl-lipoteichoic acid acyltransferase DltB (MBOAT superfamily)
MVFTSLQFVVFFVVVYALYRVLPRRAQNVALLVASYVFYGAWDWRFLGLLWTSTIVDYVVARYLGRAPDGRARTAALVVSLTSSLGMLGFFKYFDFLATSASRVFGVLGWTFDPITAHVLLPIGISFYTFMTMGYVIDVYRREIQPERNFITFALFVAYFPHLVAGPILRASLLIPQLQRSRTLSWAQSREGLWLVAWGVFQKMFVADNLAGLVNATFARTADPTGLDVLVATYAFAFQIFGDFAGYSNIARGVSKLLGIELNVNFLYPYFVHSPQQFWHHWHISLSTWLRDYLYFPLGGSRGSRWQTARNLLVTMTLGGLWHGAAWTFVLWGLYQGVLLVVSRTIAVWGTRRGLRVPPGWSWPRVALGLVTFHAMCAGWLIFRAESLSQVVDFARRFVTRFAPSASILPSLVVPLLLILAPFLIVHVYQARRGSDSAPLELARPIRYALYGAVFYLVLLFGNFEGAQFIYFQF